MAKNPSNPKRNDPDSQPNPIIKKDKTGSDKKIEPAARPGSFRDNKNRAARIFSKMGYWIWVLVIVIGAALAFLVSMALL